MPINCFDFQNPLCLAFTTFWPTTGMKTKNVCVVSMLFTQTNSFILRCNEQYILQGMPNKQDQQSQTNMSFTHIWV